MTQTDESVKAFLAKEQAVDIVEGRIRATIPEMSPAGAKKYARIVVDEAYACGCENCRANLLKKLKSFGTPPSDAWGAISVALHNQEQRTRKVDEAGFRVEMAERLRAFIPDQPERIEQIILKIIHTMTDIAMPLRQEDEPNYRAYLDAVAPESVEEVNELEQGLDKDLFRLTQIPGFVERALKIMRAEYDKLPMGVTEEVFTELAASMALRLIGEDREPNSAEITVSEHGIAARTIITPETAPYLH